MATLSYSFLPVHPGEILKEELEMRGISQKKMAELLGMSYTMLNEILNCKRQLSSDAALMFEAALGVDADMLVGIQSRYSIQIARKSQETESRMTAIRKMCASIL